MTRTLARLIGMEARLLLRDPLATTFVFAFPVVTVLVLGGVFEPGDQAFEGALPNDYYAAAYVGVVIGALGLIMLPVHLAGYRERGVLRRFEASHFPPWALPIAHVVVSLAICALGALVVAATMGLAYGMGPPEQVGRALLAAVLGALAFISIGLALGLLLPSARAAQGTGLLLFLPMFLLGGAGPPPEAMSDGMNAVADVLPLTHVIRAIQEPWLGLGGGTNHLVVVGASLVVATALWGWRARVGQAR